MPSVVLHRLRVPLLASLHTAHGTIDVRDVVLVEWRRDDGVVGWGECPTLSFPGYAGETTDVAWRALVEQLVPAALRHGDDTEAARTEGDPWFPMSSAAVRDARLDAELRAAGRSLVDEVTRRTGRAGASTRGPLTVRMCQVVGVGTSPADVRLAPGEALVKVKVTPATVGVLRDLRAAHPDLPLAADANGSFAGPDDVPPWLDDVGLAYLEQPFPAADLGAHATLRERGNTPVALDESLGSPDVVRRAVDEGAVDVVSVKHARLGGVRAAIEVLEVAAGAGLDAFVGGMVELGVGRATAAAVASHPAATLPTDLGPSSRYVARDVTEPVLAGPDGLVVPDGPGCGRTPDPDRLAELTTASAELSA